MVNSPPLYPMSVNVLVLLDWLVVCLILTIRFFKWE
jgi:ABC-2 type transport system permease protein